MVTGGYGRMKLRRLQPAATNLRLNNERNYYATDYFRRLRDMGPRTEFIYDDGAGHQQLSAGKTAHDSGHENSQHRLSALFAKRLRCEFKQTLAADDVSARSRRARQRYLESDDAWAAKTGETGTGFPLHHRLATMSGRPAMGQRHVAGP